MMFVCFKTDQQSTSKNLCRFCVGNYIPFCYTNVTKNADAFSFIICYPFHFVMTANYIRAYCNNKTITMTNDNIDSKIKSSTQRLCFSMVYEICIFFFYSWIVLSK